MSLGPSYESFITKVGLSGKSIIKDFTIFKYSCAIVNSLDPHFQLKSCKGSIGVYWKQIFSLIQSVRIMFVRRSIKTALHTFVALVFQFVGNLFCFTPPLSSFFKISLHCLKCWIIFRNDWFCFNLFFTAFKHIPLVVVCRSFLVEKLLGFLPIFPFCATGHFTCFFLFKLHHLVFQFIHSFFKSHRVFATLCALFDSINGEFSETALAKGLVASLMSLARSSFSKKFLTLPLLNFFMYLL